MKDLDIEKLTRENIYSTPPDFFSEMQSNVLNAVREKEKVQVLPAAGKSRNRAWYAAAAAVAVILGGTFVYNAGGDSEKAVASNPEVQEQNMSAAAAPASVESKEIHAAADNYTVLAEDLTLAENEYQTNRQPETKTVMKPSKAIMATGVGADARMDMILDEFSAEDIAALSMNAEQDVYLDLYN